jgi:hypothetical protein
VAAGLAGVGAAVRTVTLQADLTALVAGPPDAGLAALLDSAADRESSGVASVWRFSPGSIRRALDAGHDAEELLARLAEAATAGVPQPLGYLIRDAARRHGRVRGQEAACCLRSDDEAMLAEIAADRRLRALGLRLLAPTVLAGARPLPETLAALRAAGYAPIAESEGGAPLPEPGVTHRVQISPTRRPEHRRPDQPDPRAVACELLAEANTATPAVSATLRLVRAGAARLTDAEARLLAQAIDGGHPVSIDYLSRSGGITRRVIEDTVLVGGAVEAWCRLREDERRFSLGGILAVTPA